MTLASGMRLTPARLNADNAPRVGVRLRRAVNQSIPDGAATAISWDTEDQDTHGYWSSGTTITVPSGRGGVHVATLHVVMPTTVAGRYWAEIAPTSASSGIPGEFRDTFDSTEDRVQVTATLPLLAGDSVVCRIFQDADSSARNATAWFAMYRFSN